MLSMRITPRILGLVRRTSLPDLRTYRSLAPYVSCNALEVKDWRQQASIFRSFVPVNGHCATSVIVTSRAFTSQAPEADPQSEHEADSQTSQTEPEDPVKIIYTFQRIQTARTIAKVKIFQTALVAAVVPYFYVGYLNGMVSFLQFSSSFLLMTFSTGMLYVISDTIRKVICIMKYNKETREVYISHLTFWGRRRDVVIPLSNIVPVSDSDENITDTYILVNTYDKSESFMLFIKESSEEVKKDVLRIIG